ncbi:MAG: beta-xylosidase [Bryobacteraceae bacterium]|nr:beta-xylosidase [Bryobacteraceae bacterium]
MNLRFAVLGVVLAAGAAWAQTGQRVAVRVDVAAGTGEWRPVFRFFGYDEPNYTYMRYGKRLVGELAGIAPEPTYFRTHNLLTNGDGTPALKWGSTNAYTEDASGRAVYDWTIVDRIFDTYVQAGAKPMVEIGFMPKALSIRPEPYQHNWAPDRPSAQIFTGWAYPPKDYGKWAELVYQWVRHSVERYGRREVESWWWEVWNEPDIGYWQGTPEEYHRLYDFTAAAVKRALPTARVGGPATTNPGSAKAAAFLRQFLEHCLHGKNAATGGTGAPLDFISFHTKGAPQVADGRIRMGTGAELRHLDAGFQIVASYPALRRLPVIVSEWDPEGCAACPARLYPQNAYRNTTLYASNRAVVLKHSLELAERRSIRLEGLLTWAFEFEDQPYFEGFRTLATNGVSKPVMNFFRMAGLLGGRRVRLDSDGALGTDEMLARGARARPDVDGLATAADRQAAVMLWNYHDEDAAGPAAAVQLALAGIPKNAARVLVEHFRIDERHSNAYTAWREMGSPQQPTAEQRARLEAAGRLELLEPPRWVDAREGTVRVEFSLPRQGLSLLRVRW